MTNHNLPKHMDEWRAAIEGHAKAFGLDFHEVIFQLLTYEEINEVAAYGGFPNRYPHWRFGMEYEQTRKSHAYGMQNIFEMVVNTSPCYAYLKDCNNPVQQKSVMAHVFGHADFFKNNYAFAQTNRKMMDEMANHSTRIRKYIDKLGIDKVESFMDLCLSLEYLIDTDAQFIAAVKEPDDEEEAPADENIGKLKVKREYMNSYLNPKEAIERQKMAARARELSKKSKMPQEPEKDVLKFLLQYAPLKPWQKSILDIVREEMYYFAPQAKTKILNEGWACFCHSKIMTERVMDDSEYIEFADFHSQVASQYPGRLNPYAMGLSLLRDVEQRWNTGRHGKEYDECTDMAKKAAWDTHEGKGLEKLFEIRKFYTDTTFIDEFLTLEFCARSKLFTFSKHKADDGNIWTIIDSKQFKDIKGALLFNLTNFGLPLIYVTDGNYKNRNELLLHHRWEGVNLDMKYAFRTMKNLEKVWQRPVSLETFVKDSWRILRCDHQEINHSKIEWADLSYKQP